MRPPSIERREQLQAQYRDAVYRLALADEAGDARRIRRAQEQLANAVQALRGIGVNPILGWRP